MARPGLEPMVSRLPCEHSDNWATEPHGRLLTFSPCLIRFVPESARNNGGTTKHALFGARCPSREPTLSHQMSQGKNRGPTGTRTQGLSLTVRALCQLSYRSTWSSFDIINWNSFDRPFRFSQANYFLRSFNCVYLWRPVCFPNRLSLSKLGSTLKGKNLLRMEQILSVKSWPQLKMTWTWKMAELLFAKMYTFVCQLFCLCVSYFRQKNKFVWARHNRSCSKK